MKRLFLVLSILVFCSAVYAQNRYALVIGNSDYTGNIVKLPNAKNDTEAIYKVLKDELSYDAVLRNNLNQRAMIREIDAFITRLKNNKNSEGFLWYAGHAIEIGGDNFLLPLDVDTENESLIRNTSVSVIQFASQLSRVGNKVNVLVLDACRVPPSVGGDGRSAGDPSRLLKTVSISAPDLFIIYSTESGKEAKDGPANGNSPFAQAFLKNIKSTEPLPLMMAHVTTETLSLTGQMQRPYTNSSLGRENAYYSLNPSGVRPSPSPLPSNTTQNAKFFFERGKQFYYEGDNETAIAEFTEAIRIDSNYVDAYYHRGIIYEWTNDFDRAIADYTQAIRFGSNNEEAYNRRGTVYYWKKDYDRAIADYTQAIWINPNSIYAYNYRGDAYYNKKDYDRAIADNTQLIRLDPNNAKTYYFMRGLAYHDKKDYDRAIADFEASLKIDPDSPNAREYIEAARQKRGH
jgi:tetratricopeptide (TPR) repeat protein